MGQRKRDSSRKEARDSDRPRPPGGGRRRLFIAGGVFALVVALVAAGALFALGGGSGTGAKTAVILDQLSLTQPNPEFVSSARSILAEAGYTVDYYPGEQVTVDLYRALPARGYDLVLLRTHAGITNEVDAASGESSATEYVSLFTGEPYDAGKYPEEQLNRLGKARYYEGAPELFGIGPDFVRYSMEGSFGGARIIMMGCDGLRSQKTAEAFLDRGADAFVSWSKPVSAPHTDAATERLLELLLLDGLQTAEAVNRAASEIGPDPLYEGELRVLEEGG